MAFWKKSAIKEIESLNLQYRFSDALKRCIEEEQKGGDQLQEIREHKKMAVKGLIAELFAKGTELLDQKQYDLAKENDCRLLSFISKNLSLFEISEGVLNEFLDEVYNEIKSFFDERKRGKLSVYSKDLIPIKEKLCTQAKTKFLADSWIVEIEISVLTMFPLIDGFKIDPTLN